MEEESQAKEKNAENARPGLIINQRQRVLFLHMEKYKSILNKYLPEHSVDLIYDWLQQYNIHLKVSKKRSSKLGDYRPPQNGKGHQITVNHDLNHFAFLITLVHEVAHLLVWEKHGNKVRAHGVEWKNIYRQLMVPFFERDIFPDDIRLALDSYFNKSYASSGSDLNLSRTLQKYDSEPGLTLETIYEGSVFRLPNGKTFKKGALIRKRYRCFCIDNKRVYLVNPLVRVELVKAP
ncbi:MAG: SprT-like domain-containing protein [Bacteroidales bacterium]|nr:SprT-like domain-containing protein [Bacteroidales bacterium]